MLMEPPRNAHFADTYPQHTEKQRIALEGWVRCPMIRGKFPLFGGEQGNNADANCLVDLRDRHALSIGESKAKGEE